MWAYAAFFLDIPTVGYAEKERDSKIVRQIVIKREVIHVLKI